jgi:hypothetical protein
LESKLQVVQVPEHFKQVFPPCKPYPEAQALHVGTPDAAEGFKVVQFGMDDEHVVPSVLNVNPLLHCVHAVLLVQFMQFAGQAVQAPLENK